MSRSKTFDNLINDVIVRLSMVNGTDVQKYAEAQIAAMLQHKFDVLFEERWWPQYSAWEEHTLDGTTGVVTSDLSTTVKRFEDIRVIHAEDATRPLSQLPGTVNPNVLSGTQPLFFEPVTTVNKFFRLWPLTSTGKVQFHRRTLPADFATGSTTAIDFDSQALILGSVYDYLEDDGTNPGATDKFERMFNARVKQLGDSLDQSPIPLNPYAPVASVDVWQVTP